MAIERTCLTCGAINCQEHQRRTAWHEHTPRRTRTTSGWEQQRKAQKVMRLHDTICHVCGRPCADQVDHVTPLSQGGSDTLDNMRPIHRYPCHMEKTQREAQAGR